MQNCFTHLKDELAKRFEKLLVVCMIDTMLKVVLHLSTTFKA